MLFLHSSTHLRESLGFAELEANALLILLEDVVDDVHHLEDSVLVRAAYVLVDHRQARVGAAMRAGGRAQMNDHARARQNESCRLVKGLSACSSTRTTTGAPHVCTCMSATRSSSCARHAERCMQRSGE